MKTKQYQGIDYQFRPSSYSEPQDPLETILLNVKGTNRRKMIRDYWKAGKIDELNETLLQDSIDGGQRHSLEMIHPSFMGGEYLPDLEGSETEIARIELESTTSDVISIRTALDPAGFRYRIVDEYDSEFEQPFETSEQWLGIPVHESSGTVLEAAERIPQYSREPFALSDSNGHPAKQNPYFETIVRQPLNGNGARVPIGIFSKTYSLLQHRTVLDRALAAIKSAGVGPDEIYAELRLTEHGERMAL